MINTPIASTLIKAMHGHSVEKINDAEFLKGYHIYATPAEGEEGNSKSSITQLYHLQRFRKGPARIALEADLDSILPITIVGPEESFPSLFPVKFLKKFIGTYFPMPFLIPPIPVKWVVRFNDPIPLVSYRDRYHRAKGKDAKVKICEEIMDLAKERIQASLTLETKNRKPFLPWIFNGQKG